MSADRAAVDNAIALNGENLIDSFVLGNPHESIFPAIYGTTHLEKVHALGILETFDAAAIIQAAIDRAIAEVEPKGMYLDSSVIAQPDEQVCKSIL